MEKHDKELLAVLTTTSCFAPRGYDNVIAVAKLCKDKGINHVINSAYGLQCSRISSDLVEACRTGTVDLIISSTDKNFMVPVGGSLIYSPCKAKDGIVSKVNKMYPGRASAAPITDLFITLLQLGENRMKELLKERKENFKFL